MVLRQVSDAELISLRPAREKLDPWKPYGCLTEQERGRSGEIEDVATIFLTNRECPFRCVMCDLWKYTLTERVPVGAIPAQIRIALEQLPSIRHVKLYNAGNFFDARAIPPEDHADIAALVSRFATVIVENHPRLTNQRCVEFRTLLRETASSVQKRDSESLHQSQNDRIRHSFGSTFSAVVPELEIAMGLETIHPEILPRLNKQMTVSDFDRAVGFLRTHDISCRAFVLLNPPGLDLQSGAEWAVRSVEHAFQAGVSCCSVIPVRSGNGMMDELQRTGDYHAATLKTLEDVMDAVPMSPDRRLFADLWDIEKLADCRDCFSARLARLQRINLSQQSEPRIDCHCPGGRS
ncbi:MAG: radical SAM protein [Planctomyces sp.]